MKHILLLLPLTLGACVAVPHRDPVAPAPLFDAVAFFSGPTAGEGRLKVAFHAPQMTHVRGSGHVEADGTIVLDQDVVMGSGPSRHRQWHIRPAGPGRYTGTLTDANGPVEGDTMGNRLHLAFPSKGGLRTQQLLVLGADGRSAHNVLVVRKFGVVVAVLDEEIRKVG